jgi:hypothetical protein
MPPYSVSTIVFICRKELYIYIYSFYFRLKKQISSKKGHEGPEDELYSFFNFSHRKWSTPRPGRFTPRKDQTAIV